VLVGQEDLAEAAERLACSGQSQDVADLPGVTLGLRAGERGT
jgi:hypothetical protein